MYFYAYKYSYIYIHIPEFSNYLASMVSEFREKHDNLILCEWYNVSVCKLVKMNVRMSSAEQFNAG